jgi:hypothetical protein
MSSYLICRETGELISSREEFALAQTGEWVLPPAILMSVLENIPFSKRRKRRSLPGKGMDFFKGFASIFFNGIYSNSNLSSGDFLFSLSLKIANQFLPNLMAWYQKEREKLEQQ